MTADLALITSVANHLLEASASTATQASEEVLAQLVEHFDLDYAFLRYSDHNIRASVLAAEWPARSDVANPDPFAVVSFTSDHPALAVCDNGKELVTVHRKFEGASFFPGSLAAAATRRWWPPHRWSRERSPPERSDSSRAAAGDGRRRRRTP